MPDLSTYFFLRRNDDQGLAKEHLINTIKRTNKTNAHLLEKTTKHIENSTDKHIHQASRSTLESLSKRDNLDNKTILKELFQTINLGEKSIKI